MERMAKCESSQITLSFSLSDYVDFGPLMVFSLFIFHIFGAILSFQYMMAEVSLRLVRPEHFSYNVALRR